MIKCRNCVGDYFKTNIPQFSATRTVGEGFRKVTKQKKWCWYDSWHIIITVSVCLSHVNVHAKTAHTYTCMQACMHTHTHTHTHAHICMLPHTTGHSAYYFWKHKEFQACLEKNRTIIFPVLFWSIWIWHHLSYLQSYDMQKHARSDIQRHLQHWGMLTVNSTKIRE